jgi:Xaa-Pro aminopeptidase
MRYLPIDPKLFINNRANLTKLMLPNSLAVLVANDILPTNADGSLPLCQNSDLFYLSGVDQEETILLLYPDAHDEKMREILFVRETNDMVVIWEGHKLTKEQARKATGIQRVEWLSEFPALFRRLICESEHVYLNSNEYKRASVEVETREMRFLKDTQASFPLHDYQRLARLMHRLRAVKSEPEVELIKQACAITKAGFLRVCRSVKPGITETRVEAEYAYEFIRRGGNFAYTPIIASGKNACALHYIKNDQTCRNGELLLLDVAANYANYNSDLTRTIPVNGKFTRRQRQVYNAVLRSMRACAVAATPGKVLKDWQKESEAIVERELLELGLIKKSDIRKQDPDKPALKKYFMHGIGHPIGLDVHDVGLTVEPFQPGWVLTVEPGIYIPEEGFAVRLENIYLVQAGGNVDLMADIPVEADEIEALMHRRGR